MPSLLFLSQSRQELHQGRIHDRLGQGLLNHLNSTFPIKRDPSSSLVAEAAVVHSPQVDVDRLIPTLSTSRPFDTGQRDGLPSRHSIAESGSLEDTPALKRVLN